MTLDLSKDEKQRIAQIIESYKKGLSPKNLRALNEENDHEVAPGLPGYLRISFCSIGLTASYVTPDGKCMIINVEDINNA